MSEPRVSASKVCTLLYEPSLLPSTFYLIFCSQVGMPLPTSLSHMKIYILQRENELNDHSQVRDPVWENADSETEAQLRVMSGMERLD